MSTENKTATEQAMRDKPTRLEAWAARTPETMRREMFEMAHRERGWQEQFRLEHCSPLVRRVFDMADIQGLSGEDRYTVLAYMALQSLASAQGHLLAMLNVTPATGLFKPGERKA